MIKYNSNTINDWNFGTSNLIKVYRNNAIVFYKISGDSPTPEYKVCFAVVDDISQYTDREFEDVFDNATEKWYKLNNLNQYEEYGVYGEGRNITYYEGKLTIDDGYEYEWNGSSWVNLGEVSGSTATLPNKSFVLNYNAKNYNATTNSIPYTSGQSKAIDAIQNYGTNTIIDHSSDGYISVTANTRLTISGGTTSMYRTNTETGCTMTIVSKARTTKNYSILTCRGSAGTNQMNWMWRYPSNGIFLHGSSSYNKVTYYTTTSANPITASVRVSWNGSVQQQINDWTNNGSYSGAFQYGSYQTVNNNGSLFCDYLTNNDEFWQGDFYWAYMSQEVLSDEEIQQVINYNEGDGGSSEYPIYYAEKSDPPDNLSFSSMTEAESYECPWWGMSADIDNTDYMFCEGNEWLTKYTYIEVSDDYLCDNGNKYKKMQEYDRIPDGTTTATTTYVKGDLIESASTDCSTDYSTYYLTFVAQTDNVTFSYSTATSSNKLQYSIDGGSTWVDLGNNQSTSSINNGDRIMFKASGLTVNTERGIGKITPSASATVEGNIMSLEYGDNFIGQTVVQNNYQFRKLFSGVTTMTSAENMVIPATTITKQCYSQMFQGCSNLVTAPKVIGSSAMTWSGDYCLSDMFNSCTSLVNAPQLPALNLGAQCYWYMFQNCTSLTTAPELLATTTASQCYNGMFSGCISLNYIKVMSSNGFNMNEWVKNVASNGIFVKSSTATFSSCGQNTYPCNWTVQNA